MTEESSSFRSGVVAIVGRPNVGKSTLLNRILGQKIAITSPKPQTTRNRILGILHRPDGQVLLLDTPGVHRPTGKLNRYMVGQALAACQEVDLVLMLADAAASSGGGDDFIMEQLARSGKPVFLVINKSDLVPRERLLPLIAGFAQRFPFREIIPVSALTGEGIDDLVHTVLSFLPPGPAFYPEEMVTDLTERFIVGEIVREKVLLHTREEVPHGVAVTVERFEEKSENLAVIHAVIHVERPTHKGIVLGKGGAMVRRIGQEARREIEGLLGCRVFLELFVRVDEKWTQSDRLLREFGYE